MEHNGVMMEEEYVGFLPRPARPTAHSGQYSWDSSSYCQRWIIHKKIQSLRNSYACKVRGKPL